MDIEVETRAFISEWLMEHELCPEDIDGKFHNIFPWIELTDLMKAKGLVGQVRKHVNPHLSKRFIFALALSDLADRYVSYIDSQLEKAIQVNELTEAD